MQSYNQHQTLSQIPTLRRHNTRPITRPQQNKIQNSQNQPNRRLRNISQAVQRPNSTISHQSTSQRTLSKQPLRPPTRQLSVHRPTKQQLQHTILHQFQVPRHRPTPHSQHHLQQNSIPRHPHIQKSNPHTLQRQPSNKLPRSVILNRYHVRPHNHHIQRQRITNEQSVSRQRVSHNIRHIQRRNSGPIRLLMLRRRIRQQLTKNENRRPQLPTRPHIPKPIHHRVVLRRTLRVRNHNTIKTTHNLQTNTVTVPTTRPKRKLTRSNGNTRPLTQSHIRRKHSILTMLTRHRILSFQPHPRRRLNIHHRHKFRHDNTHLKRQRRRRPKNSGNGRSDPFPAQYLQIPQPPPMFQTKQQVTDHPKQNTNIGIVFSLNGILVH